MNKADKIYVAGHRGMVGSAIVRRLEREGFTNVITRTSGELNLTRQTDVEDFFAIERPDYVFVTAARVGGIMANSTRQAEFLLDNLQIQNNIIQNSYKNEVKKLLFLGSSCIYPTNAPQPIQENALLTSPLEPTNEGYAIAKIAGLKMCEYLARQQGVNYISLMPCNLYGYNDNFDLVNSHFLPALIRKFYEAKRDGLNSVVIWGTGTPKRELLFVDDLAGACLFAMQSYSSADFLNVGYGEDYSITQFAEMLKEISGFKGEIIYDTSKPDGMARKIMDSSKIRSLGWQPETSLKGGLKSTYEWYRQNTDSARG